MESKKSFQVVLFSCPLQGHISPILQLADILYSQGFSITIIHINFDSLNTSEYPHFTFHFINPDSFPTEKPAEDIIAFASWMNTSCVAQFKDCLAGVLSSGMESGEQVACLITDSVLHFTQAIADELKVRRIVMRTTSVCSFLGFAAVPLLRRLGYIPLEESRLDDLMPELPPFKVKDIYMFKTRHPEDLFHYIENVVKETKASSGLLWNTFEELEHTAITELSHQFPVPIFQIGPLHKYFPTSSSSLLEQDRTAVSWLDKQQPRSVIYVSFGSLAMLDGPDFLEMAYGLANSNQPFLWAMRPGIVRGAEWIELLPNGFLEMIGERGHIVKWAPQQEVLAHRAIGGFWTHGGWNSTLESICEGVPMICQPFFGDQRANTRYISDVWRIGIHLENRLERGEIESAIRRLMVGEEGRQIRERVKSLKEKVETCLKPGGSSYQSLERLVHYISSV